MSQLCESQSLLLQELQPRSLMRCHQAQISRNVDEFVFVSSRLYCVHPWETVVNVAGALGDGSMGIRGRSREPGLSGGEGLCQGSRGGKDGQSTSPLAPGAWVR